MNVLPPSGRGRLAGSALVTVLLGTILLATSPGLPLAWDEGDAILRAEQIPHVWPYTTCREGHPAFYGIVIALGRWASGAWLGPLESARFGPIALFALAAGAMFYRMARDYSVAAGLGAVAALALLPRLFAHAHFASFDGPLTSCWILAWATFPGDCFNFRPSENGTVPLRALGEGLPTPTPPPPTEGLLDLRRPTVKAVARSDFGELSRAGDRPQRVLRTWVAAVIWGMLLGMTFSCKATGWIAPLPFLVWTAVYRDRAAARALCIGMPVAVATFFALNPPLWHEPLQGWATFFRLNFDRASQPGLNISTQFFGRMYNLDYSLPWYNTLVWTAITVPLGVLLLAAAGVVAAVRRWRENRAGTLLLTNWLVLLVVRALPGTPPHDAERLFLPSFAFLAALAGVGCAEVIARAVHRLGVDPGPEPSPERGRLGRHPEGTRRARCPRSRYGCGLLIFFLYAGSASSLWWYAPQWLSYYNLLIGGLPGATALGMEPTYYWDGLDRSVLDWLREHTATDEKICFAAAPPENLALLWHWNVLRRSTCEQSPGRFRWYVLQRRPSGMQPADVWLVEHARPVYYKTIRRGGFGPWRLDVPLVEIYPYEDYLRACAQISLLESR